MLGSLHHTWRWTPDFTDEEVDGQRMSELGGSYGITRIPTRTIWPLTESPPRCSTYSVISLTWGQIKASSDSGTMWSLSSTSLTLPGAPFVNEKNEANVAVNYSFKSDEIFLPLKNLIFTRLSRMVKKLLDSPNSLFPFTKWKCHFEGDSSVRLLWEFIHIVFPLVMPRSPFQGVCQKEYFGLFKNIYSSMALLQIFLLPYPLAKITLETQLKPAKAFWSCSLKSLHANLSDKNRQQPEWQSIMSYWNTASKWQAKEVKYEVNKNSDWQRHTSGCRVLILNIWPWFGIPFNFSFLGV